MEKDPRMIITEALKLILYRHETGDLKYGLSKDDVDELEVALAKAERIGQWENVTLQMMLIAL